MDFMRVDRGDGAEDEKGGIVGDLSVCARIGDLTLIRATKASWFIANCPMKRPAIWGWGRPVLDTARG